MQEGSSAWAMHRLNARHEHPDELALGLGGRLAVGERLERLLERLVLHVRVRPLRVEGSEKLLPELHDRTRALASGARIGTRRDREIEQRDTGPPVSRALVRA